MPPLSTAPELRNLSEQDVEFIDEVIRRAGPSTTSFDVIYAAYAALLKERRMDLQEARLYKKLLKMGNLKGKNWGDKWEIVKSSAGSRTEDTPSTIARSEVSSRLTIGDDETPKRSSKPTRVAHRQERLSSVLDTPPPRFPAKSTTRSKTSESLERLNRLVNQRTTSSVPTLSTVLSVDGDSTPPLPSYKSTYTPEFQIPTPPKDPMPLPSRDNKPRKRVPQITAIAQHALGQPTKPRRMPNVDVDEVWKNIEMGNNEKLADEHYSERIMMRYFGIWREGSKWVIDTQIQVDDARNKMLQQQAFERWLAQLTKLRTKEDGILKEFNAQLLRTMLGTWQAKFKQRRQAAWRTEMRQKLTSIRNKLDLKLKTECLDKWLEVTKFREADRKYLFFLLRRTLGKWRDSIARIHALENRADTFLAQSEDLALVSAWNTWKGQLGMRWNEHAIAQRVHQRIYSETIQQWKRMLVDSRQAEAFSQDRVKRAAVSFWKERLERVRDLDIKLLQFAQMQNANQLRTTLRIWRTSMRGKKLEKYRLQRTAFRTLLGRYAKQKEQMGRAIAFQQQRSTASLTVSAILRWKEVLQKHRNDAAFVDQYHDRQIQIRFLLAWRLRLRDVHEQMRNGRLASRFFTTRTALRIWLNRMAGRVREKRLQAFQEQQAKKYFVAWHAKTKESRIARFFEAQREQRLVQNLMHKWVNSVIEIKIRELDVAQQYDMTLQATAFQRWKSRRQRNLELQKLLESQLLVRQEGLLIRAFRHWLAAKRSVEQKRHAYEQKEEQMRQMIITAAWDKWRERFKEERLRPLEYEVIIRQQRNMMARALNLWQRKTLNLPAVNFDTRRLKTKYIRSWKNALPLAQQYTKAREKDRENVLRFALGRWKAAYQTKTTLKFVERAKSLRNVGFNKPIKPLVPRPLTFASRGRVRQPVIESTDDDATSIDESRPILTSRPLASRALLRPTSRLNTTSTRQSASQTRQSSPARSIASYAGRRRSRSPTRAPSVVSAVSDGDRLWSALKGFPPRRR